MYYTLFALAVALTAHRFFSFIKSFRSIFFQVRIQGDDLAKVHKCRDDILELVDRLQNECFEKIYVQRRFLPLIVGTGGKKLNELRAKFPFVEDIDIPWAKNPKEGGDDDCCYITLYGRRNEVSFVMDGAPHPSQMDGGYDGWGVSV